MVTSFAETTWYYLLMCRAAYMSTCKVGTCIYFLPTVHISIGLEGNLAEACDVDGLRLQ